MLELKLIEVNGFLRIKKFLSVNVNIEEELLIYMCVNKIDCVLKLFLIEDDIEFL